MPETTQPPVVLDGRRLRRAEVERVARHGATISVAAEARDRVAAAHTAALRIARERPVYGLSTGVGANRAVPVQGDDLAGHGIRLLRSHAARNGPVEDDETVRAALAIRLNQLLAGGSGVRAELVDALAGALVGGSLPAVHGYGALGTADLSPLAEIGLTLAGELPWARGGVPPVRFVAGEALAFMSSSAVTLAKAALACGDLARLVDAGHVVGALSFLALGGNVETYDPAAHATVRDGSARVARRLRELLGATRPARRLQDPFALRALPQVGGAAVEGLDRAVEVIDAESNVAAENPLVVTGDTQPRVVHHGGFHAASVASALDSARLAIAPAAALSGRRLTALLEPELTGLPAFLASDPPGSSGVLVLEYVAQDALAEIQHTAAPAATTGTPVLSRGVEDHASFATQSARRTGDLARLLPTVVGCELVAAVRALRLAPERLSDGPVRAAYEQASAVLPDDPTDRPLGADIAAAAAILPRLTDIPSG